MKEYDLVVSGPKWARGNILSTEKSIKDLIDKSVNTLMMTIYIITDDTLIEHIIKALKRQVSITIYMYQHDKIKKKDLKRLMELNQDYDNLELYITKKEYIHSKVLVSDTKNLIIGSANLTDAGYNRNYELGIKLNDSAIAYEIERILRRLS